MYRNLNLLIITLSIFFSNTACSTAKGEMMSDQLLSVKAVCKNNPKCYFENKDIDIEITIQNISSISIGYPLEFSQKTGPSINLSDNRSKVSFPLSTNLADWDLAKKLTTIPPGKSVTIKWTISKSEISELNDKSTDANAEIIVGGDILVNNKTVKFRGKDTLHIVGVPENGKPIGQFNDLRCEAGKPCPKDGHWFTPASANSRRLFKQGEIMPNFSNEYGLVIWQWDGEA